MASTKRESRGPPEVLALPRSEAWEAGQTEDEDEEDEEVDAAGRDGTSSAWTRRARSGVSGVRTVGGLWEVVDGGPGIHGAPRGAER